MKIEKTIVTDDGKRFSVVMRLHFEDIIVQLVT